MSATQTLTLLQANASRLIRSYGQKVKLSKTDGTVKSGYALLFGATSNKGPSSDDFISSNDQLCYLEGKIGVAPEDGDTLTFGRTAFTIHRVSVVTLGTDVSQVPVYKLAVTP